MCVSPGGDPGGGKKEEEEEEEGQDGDEEEEEEGLRSVFSAKWHAPHKGRIYPLADGSRSSILAAKKGDFYGGP